jgi:hypothetical protein
MVDPMAPLQTLRVHIERRLAARDPPVPPERAGEGRRARVQRGDMAAAAGSAAEEAEGGEEEEDDEDEEEEEVMVEEDYGDDDDDGDEDDVSSDDSGRLPGRRASVWRV